MASLFLSTSGVPRMLSVDVISHSGTACEGFSPSRIDSAFHLVMGSRSGSGDHVENPNGGESSSGQQLKPGGGRGRLAVSMQVQYAVTLAWQQCPACCSARGQPRLGETRPRLDVD